MIETRNKGKPTRRWSVSKPESSQVSKRTAQSLTKYPLHQVILAIMANVDLPGAAAALGFSQARLKKYLDQQSVSFDDIKLIQMAALNGVSRSYDGLVWSAVQEYCTASTLSSASIREKFQAFLDDLDEFHPTSFTIVDMSTVMSAILLTNSEQDLLSMLNVSVFWLAACLDKLGISCESVKSTFQTYRPVSKVQPEDVSPTTVTAVVDEDELMAGPFLASDDRFESLCSTLGYPMDQDMFRMFSKQTSLNDSDAFAELDFDLQTSSCSNPGF